MYIFSHTATACLHIYVLLFGVDGRHLQVTVYISCASGYLYELLKFKINACFVVYCRVKFLVFFAFRTTTDRG